MRNLTLLVILVFLGGCEVDPTPKKKNIPRVIVTTDINNAGGDPDDKQSMAHLFMYANQVQIEAIIPDYWKGKGVEATYQAIEAYAKDYANPTYKFQAYHYPAPDTLKAMVAVNKQDAIDRIIFQANKEDSRPLYILIWGNMNTLKDALLKAPEIADKIRVLTIATNLMAQNPDSKMNARVEKYCVTGNWNSGGRNDIFDDSRFHNLWWIENDWAYNGMFEGNQPMSFLDEIKEFGNLGYHIWEVVQSRPWARYFRAGDTPTLLFLLEPIDHDRPTKSTWSGAFVNPFPDERPNYWIDDAADENWDYKNPCNSWDQADRIYQNRVNSLLRSRENMYNAYRKKMKDLYGQ